MIQVVFEMERKGSSLGLFEEKVAKDIQSFHQSIPGYNPTPLVSLPHLADYLGVESVFVKDESYRFGLNAFKALGGSYAMGREIARKLRMDSQKMTFGEITSEAVKKQLGEVVFVTATDGNHGRGVAWMARQLGQKSVVYMPKGSAWERLENIRREGAHAEILDMNYDEAVRYAAHQAKEHGWIVIQDTGWEGYEEVPLWVMQGYMTMAKEAWEQLEGQVPTHLFLQAGVGSMAAAVCGFFKNLYPQIQVAMVEPEKADCLYRTAKANDGQIHRVSGDLQTIMAGLACGEPNPLGWPTLRDYSGAFFSCNDGIAAKGMRILGNPLRGDEKVISGESGAVGVGLLAALMKENIYQDIRARLGLNQSSKVLFFSTEGDTDFEGYLDVVWNCKNS